MSELNQLPEDLKGPPEDLSAQSKEFFLHVIATGPYDAPARALLIEFCRVRDRLARCRLELVESGFTFNDKHKQPRMHPLVKHELALTNEYGKLFRLLGWDQAPPDGCQMPLFGVMTRASR